jgi:hypothetical protein
MLYDWPISIVVIVVVTAIAGSIRVLGDPPNGQDTQPNAGRPIDSAQSEQPRGVFD